MSSVLSQPRNGARAVGDQGQARGLVAELEARLALIGCFFGLDAIAAERFPRPAVVRHYRESDLGYRLLHSWAGAVHMALNPGGRFDRAGYARQAETIAEAAARRACRVVVELGSGRGYNLGLLGKRLPQTRFLGLDITPTHLRQARRRAAANVGFGCIDFEALALGDATVDLVFEVESLCHATDMAQALSEVRRVLAPGGRFLCFDGFEAAPGRAADEATVRRACRLTEAAMAVDHAWSVSDWVALAESTGLRLRRDEDLSASVLPNLARFERLSRAYFRYRWLARLLLRVAPRSVNRIAVAGLLILPLVRAGVYSYRLLTLERMP